MDGLAPGLKSIRPGSFPEAPIGYIKNANEQVRVKIVTGVLGPAGFVVLEQHGRLPATPYHPLFYLPPPPVPLSMYLRILTTMSTYHVFHA